MLIVRAGWCDVEMPTFIDSRIPRGAFAAPDVILVATNLQDGDNLFPHVVAQAKASDAYVVLVHAILPAVSISVEAGEIPSVDQLPRDRDVRSMLADMASRIKARGISCDFVCEHGYAADVIREELRNCGATRLIMGTHGRGKLGELAFGSVACELLKTVEIPIFAIGPRSESHEGKDGFPRKILHPVSFMGAYQKTIDLSFELARAYEAELSLLHVLHSSAIEGWHYDSTAKWTKSALDALAQRGIGMASPVQAMVSCGDVVDEILKAAIQMSADWIVMGVDQSFPFWSLKDSKAYRVLAAARCPVLTIRHDQRRNPPKRAELATAAAAIR